MEYGNLVVLCFHCQHGELGHLITKDLDSFIPGQHIAIAKCHVEQLFYYLGKVENASSDP